MVGLGQSGEDDDDVLFSVLNPFLVGYFGIYT